MRGTTIIALSTGSSSDRLNQGVAIEGEITRFLETVRSQPLDLIHYAAVTVAAVDKVWRAGRAGSISRVARLFCEFIMAQMTQRR
jgi:hypothetical protein